MGHCGYARRPDYLRRKTLAEAVQRKCASYPNARIVAVDDFSATMLYSSEQSETFTIWRGKATEYVPMLTNTVTIPRDHLGSLVAMLQEMRDHD